jgi:hypothetical protein
LVRVMGFRRLELGVGSWELGVAREYPQSHSSKVCD